MKAVSNEDPLVMYMQTSAALLVLANGLVPHVLGDLQQ